MKNPWTEITKDQRVLKSDQAIITEYNKSRKSNPVNTDDYPEPFLGDPNAKIYLLLGNPGKTDQETIKSYLKEIEDSPLEEIILNSLKHNNNKLEYPFYLLDPKFKSHSGAKWWKKAMNGLIDEFGAKFIANNIFGMELYGYHTKTRYEGFSNSINKRFLNSTLYNHYLLKKAIEENKLILLGRAIKDWFLFCHELSTYENCYFLGSNRGIQLNKHTIPPRVYMELKKKL